MAVIQWWWRIVGVRELLSEFVRRILPLYNRDPTDTVGLTIQYRSPCPNSSHGEALTEGIEGTAEKTPRRRR